MPRIVQGGFRVLDVRVSGLRVLYWFVFGFFTGSMRGLGFQVAGLRISGLGPDGQRVQGS